MLSQTSSDAWDTLKLVDFGLAANCSTGSHPASRLPVASLSGWQNDFVPFLFHALIVHARQAPLGSYWSNQLSPTSVVLCQPTPAVMTIEEMNEGPCTQLSAKYLCQLSKHTLKRQFVR